MPQDEKEKNAFRIPHSTLKKFLRFFLIFLLIWSLIAWIAARALIVNQEIPGADLIVVLGGAASYVERTNKAATLWKEGRAPKIFLTNDGLKSGWSRKERRNPYFAERAKNELLNQGVTEDAIEVSSVVVESTLDEAHLLRELLPQKNVRSVLIVTSPYHTRRALRIIEKELTNTGIEVGITSPPTGEQSPRPYLWWLSPNGWNAVGGEYVKLIYYRLFY